MQPLRDLIERVTGRQPLSHHEMALSAVSALVALLLITFISKKFLTGLDLPFIVASMGASAVLLFAVPSSPMNHPWAVAAGHLCSAVIGVTCAQHIGSLTCCPKFFLVV